MSEAIKLQVEWDANKALKASKILYDYDLKHSSKRYIGWLFIALLQFGVVASFKHQDNLLLLISTFLVTYWYFGRWYLRSIFIKKYYKKQNLQKTILLIECDQNGITVQNKRIPWNEVVSVIDTKSILLFQIQDNILSIPYDAFANIDDLSNCTSLLKTKGKL